VQSAGSLLDLFGGFQLAQGYDPQLSISGAQLTRLFQMSALALMFSSGAYQLLLGGWRGVSPPSRSARAEREATVHAMVTATTNMFVSSLQIAGPLIIVLFLADLGLGLADPHRARPERLLDGVPGEDPDHPDAGGHPVRRPSRGRDRTDRRRRRCARGRAGVTDV
jgi:Type III secretory pathway, component EscT